MCKSSDATPNKHGIFAPTTAACTELVCDLYNSFTEGTFRVSTNIVGFSQLYCNKIISWEIIIGLIISQVIQNMTHFTPRIHYECTLYVLDRESKTTFLPWLLLTFFVTYVLTSRITREVVLTMRICCRWELKTAGTEAWFGFYFSLSICNKRQILTLNWSWRSKM